jgi:transposase-like protein
MRKRYTAEQRDRLVTEVRTTGAPVRVIAERLGVTVSSAYLWLKDAGPAQSAPVFARVVPTPSTARRWLTLEVGVTRIRVETGFDADLLREVVSALSDAS